MKSAGVFSGRQAAEWETLRQAIQILQREIREAPSVDQRHNALTLKVVLGLNAFATLRLADIVNSYALQFQLRHEENGRWWPVVKLLGAGRQSAMVPLIEPLALDVQCVLNPRRSHQAHAFGWRECGRFVPLHPQSLQRRWQRLGLRALRGGRWLRAYWRQQLTISAETWEAKFCAAALGLAQSLGWEPTPENWNRSALLPNQRLGEGVLPTLGYCPQQAQDYPIAVARW